MYFVGTLLGTFVGTLKPSAMPKLASANATQIRNAKPKAKDWRLGCGEGLYLRITPNGHKYWQLRYKQASGKETIKQFAAYPKLSLEQARAWRDQFFSDLAQPNGIYPHAGTGPFVRTPKQIPNQAPSTEAIAVPTFEVCAARFIQAKRPEWSNPKHATQWENTLRDYAFERIGQLAVDRIERADVLACLEPIWLTKNETATRLRGRIETIWNWAKAHGYVHGDNPAAWKGALQPLLASPSKLQKTQSHPAMPYTQVADFMRVLLGVKGVAALALRFLILNACRTTEVIEASWSELDDGLWTIPADRMKAGREHRVPLANQSLELLASVPKTGHFVFGRLLSQQHQVQQKNLSNMAMAAILKQHGGKAFTVHGFRSSFRDWAAEKTQVPREICEHALAHQLPDKVEAAYLRTDWLEQRRALMQQWADFVLPHNHSAHP